MDHMEYTRVTAHEDDVDRESHKEGDDGVARLNNESSVRGETAPPDESNASS